MMTTEEARKHKQFLLLMRDGNSSNWSIDEEFDSIWEFEKWLKEAQIYADYLLVENIDWHITTKT